MTAGNPSLRTPRQNTKLYYRQQVHGIIRMAEGSQGYISLGTLPVLNHHITELQYLAQNYFEKGEIRQALDISTVIVDEASPALGFTDDCKGDVMEMISVSLTLLRNISFADPDEKTAKYLFTYFLKLFRERVFLGWDWHFGIMDIIIKLISSEKEAESAKRVLEKEMELKQHRSDTEHYLDLLEQKILEVLS